ncbi:MULTISPECIES: GMC family oxidoreductase N-terminal domain-containing protein [unclassified Pseudomonas]|uniref:GMC family oxidoreductase n=3 Tax=Pseudomonas TaxID=286 RepID=UPI002AC99054|nr:MULTISPECIES: GMC family oxidoreductase N-terminal domain-containing protein [unclassified Pseudomonas]MEB0039328.1 GMC family oxidoreductase N-terminal domain-containing protein [Pseudomonas sp. MH10]MEB0076024.1 GMC family oxidoreductase N-terminal domain-containing protein [Pseudomonas sp. MH10out]MEB0090870.1 GMC family oxidoreductase N-terminal domain-containing protein [Pseudomonas sp. CCI4.2]MEB0119767.1 GMC family oxidoreductase N-terminal domain-containing protein [Pseudomonas sp. C
MTYDYIIAGAGAAGCILANRLSASGKHTVLLLEAGGKDSSLWFKIPVGFAKMYYNPTFNWMYYSQPQKQLNNREIYAPRGKVQGGSGSINAMIFVRGQAHDFDDWAANGNEGWGFKDVLPYFRKLENHPLGDSEYHGGSGPISITPMKGQTHPICDVFLKGCDELGYPHSDDFNGPTFEGSGIYDVNTRKGQRCSSSFAHLHPALSRPNLTVELHALVDRVIFDEAQQRATGISVTQNGVVRTFTANKEVILCAGAVDTPKILQLSGVGDQALLAKHAIPLVKHLPAVGQNLQDHLCASYYYKANIPTLNDQLSSLFGQFKLGLKYLLTRKGALAMSVNQAGGFFRGNEAQAYPNLQLYFNPLSYQIPKNNKASLKPEPYSGFLLCFNPCRPTSRGAIEIASKNPRDAALIDPNYLSTQKDIDEVIQGSRLMRKIMQAPALKGITVEEVLPGPAVESDEQMLQYFRENSGSIYHLCGSCAMGADEHNSVVDKELKVHGIKGLRIVDASIFPNLTSGNTHAAVLMVAEKGADLILRGA